MFRLCANIDLNVQNGNANAFYTRCVIVAAMVEGYCKNACCFRKKKVQKSRNEKKTHTGTGGAIKDEEEFTCTI